MAAGQQFCGFIATQNNRFTRIINFIKGVNDLFLPAPLWGDGFSIPKSGPPPWASRGNFGELSFLGRRSKLDNGRAEVHCSQLYERFLFQTVFAKAVSDRLDYPQLE